MKVAFLTPSRGRPSAPYLAALEASVPLLDAAGLEHQMGVEIGPYISHNRATLLRKALDAGADTVVFIDDDLSWDPLDLVTLIQTDGEVVSGLYRFKTDTEAYMGILKTLPNGMQILRHDGCIRAEKVPAGFLKVTRQAVRRFMRAHPQLVYGDPENPSVDLFNHGAHEGVWYGEDYAFSRRWLEAGGEIWVRPDLNLTHHEGEKSYPGNFHDFLLRQPGGSKSDCPRLAA